MQIALPPQTVHLSYCTNIHAGESWEEVAASLEETVPLIRTRLELADEQAFGIGLRLSGQAALSLSEPATLQAFQAQLQRLNAYVFTINAFPYGPFHAVGVKEQVYQPDWRHEARLAYTAQCARILTQLLPDGVEGSISTVPGGFRAEVQGVDAQQQVVEQLLRAVAMLAKLEEQSGKSIALALEPEPCCFLETAAEVRAFFTEQLWATASIAKLADLCETTEAHAARLMRHHLGICYDVCHAAVEFEDPVASMQALTEIGIRIPKIQLSCALRIKNMQDDLLPALQRYDDGVYLHQVVARQADGLQRYVDLPPALAAYAAGKANGEWRVHCHVPIFWDGDEQLEGVGLGSTRDDLLATLRALQIQGFSSHLEVETYTWDVLPAHLKTEAKATAIARELSFVMKELQQPVRRSQQNQLTQLKL
ncbi:metabolite traffic protein EboE [Undibacterium sp. TS12]|uniref:metabolite traffic protein EboE n=1 Tax=Undibacterium sp. TS12 TaxID=2908202 RepID=UPI001F4CBDC8|nr:metabolite traffic protein EboE [Undibacterium sp. TS12]MCH8617573.1 metabolite traffic protein EboE [Undibacterium sp. TS12]